MKKVLVGLSVALLALGTFGCSKDKDSKSAADAGEVLRQVEVFSSINDARAADPNTALTCTYALISESNGAYSISKAEVKTSGSCNFDDVKSKAVAAGSLDSGKAAQIVSVIGPVNMISQAQPSFNCRAYNIKTSMQAGGVSDCVNGNGSNDAVAKSITAILGL